MRVKPRSSDMAEAVAEMHTRSRYVISVSVNIRPNTLWRAGIPVAYYGGSSTYPAGKIEERKRK
jgi:hypothetical protein